MTNARLWALFLAGVKHLDYDIWKALKNPEDLVMAQQEKRRILAAMRERLS